jgi:hypothetical protein
VLQNNLQTPYPKTDIDLDIAVASALSLRGKTCSPKRPPGRSSRGVSDESSSCFSRGAQPDFITQLQQLTQLKQAGALSEDEFQAAKAKLLSS